MPDFMASDFLPNASQLGGLLGLIVATASFALIGRLTGCHRGVPEAPILCGWSVFVLATTLVGIATPIPLSFVLWGFVGVAVLGAGWLAMRRELALSATTWRYIALGTLFLAVASAMSPAAVDSFTHWLPNAAYLFEFDHFPRQGMTGGLSSYPGFPYGFALVPSAAGEIMGRFAENTAILFNALLLILFAALLGRMIALSGFDDPSGRFPAVGWGAAALSIILVSFASPVFVRKVVFTAYPDAATAVVVAYLGVAGWMFLNALAEDGKRAGALALQCGLLGALLINLKQANLVLFACIFAGMLLVAIRDRRVSLAGFLSWTPVLLLPGLILYGGWRLFVEAEALGENKIRPMADWPLDRIPELLERMGSVMLRKSGHFAIMLFFLWRGVMAFLRVKHAFDRLALILATVFVGYTAFLVFIYVAHFNGYPQSYWRYNLHIGYFGYAAAVYGVACLWRMADRLSILEKGAPVAILLAFALPIAGASYIRYDRLPPVPYIRTVGQELGGMLPEKSRLLLYLPGDNGNLSSILRYYARRGQPGLAIDATLEDASLRTASRPASAEGTYFWAFCGTPALYEALDVAPFPKQSALLRYSSEGWQATRHWDLPVARRYHKSIDPRRCGLK